MAPSRLGAANPVKDSTTEILDRNRNCTDRVLISRRYDGSARDDKINAGLGDGVGVSQIKTSFQRRLGDAVEQLVFFCPLSLPRGDDARVGLRQYHRHCCANIKHPSDEKKSAIDRGAEIR